ncbi:MAG: cytochrome c biogenesis protein DipZ [Thermoleophilaceae bacterium]|nr:cytochrome c biogenesis protein DipZ [Thermoleophilaceae bacterium]
MVVLLIFGVLAGAGTALSPCVLPVLPALLSAANTGGRRRPLGIVLGLVITHTVVIVGLATLTRGVGLADGFLRTFAILVLLFFGLSLLVPRMGDAIEARLSGLARFGPKDSGEGFWSGVGVGGALGFVYAPCAGPILAAVISVSASQGTSFELVLLAIAYGVGSAGPLLVFALGGRRAGESLRKAGRGPTLQRAMGVTMLVVAALMFADLDIRFQEVLAKNLPDAVANPTAPLEKTDAVQRRLTDLRGESKFDSDRADAKQPAQPPPPGVPPLDVLGVAPEFTDTQKWFNTANGRKLTLEELRGRVVLIDFWTYTCINCIRTLPELREWDRRYKDSGLTIVGVHTPEFAFEREAGNVADSIRENDLRYPVAQDNEYGTWNAWGNNAWPAKYLIDAEGRVRYSHFGEGEYDETEEAIRALLEESGRDLSEERTQAKPEVPRITEATPETYLGSARAEGFLPEPPKNGTRRYDGDDITLPTSHAAFDGVWKVDEESAEAVKGASLRQRFQSEKVFLVLSGRGKVRVLLDGKPLKAADADEDVRSGVVRVNRQRLYRLVDLPEPGEHELELRFDPGVEGFAFTYG